MLFTFLTVTTLFSASLGALIPRDTNSSLSLTERLELASTQIARIQLLADNGGNSSFKFSFNNPPAGAVAENTTSGSVVAAVGASFPALIGLDASLVKFSLGPCAMIVPHMHPRADEFVITVSGTIFTQFITESGSEIISNNISSYDSTIFPKGSIHLELNPTCKESVFLGFLNSNDPGTTLIAPGFFSLDETAVLTQLGGVVSGADLASIEKGLPAGPVAVVEQCLKACGIYKKPKRSISEFV